MPARAASGISLPFVADRPVLRPIAFVERGGATAVGGRPTSAATHQS